MTIRHALSALWALRSKKAALQHLHPVQLRRASFFDLLPFLYHKLRSADLPGVPEWHQGLTAGDRIELVNPDATCRSEYRRTLVVTVPAYRNRHGEWIPPKTRDVTGMYEPGNGKQCHEYDGYFFGNKGRHE